VAPSALNGSCKASLGKGGVNGHAQCMSKSTGAAPRRADLSGPALLGRIWFRISRSNLLPSVAVDRLLLYKFVSNSAHESVGAGRRRRCAVGSILYGVLPGRVNKGPAYVPAIETFYESYS
jgi:hypothetical protein